LIILIKLGEEYKLLSSSLYSDFWILFRKINVSNILLKTAYFVDYSKKFSVYRVMVGWLVKLNKKVLEKNGLAWLNQGNVSIFV
jgi:hypothetical protein